MARNTKATTGVRTPSMRTLENVEAEPSTPAEQKVAKPGKTIFRTGAGMFNIQVSAPQAFNLPSGEKVIPRPKVARLSSDKDFETDDPDIIAALKRHPKFGWTKEHKGAFWTLEQELEMKRVNIVAENRTKLAELKKQDPEAFEATLAELKQLETADFELSAQ
jgi:hypothetical protein